MLPSNPRKLIGPWEDGYALDMHTTGSTYLGEELGHPRFDNTYSEIGKLLNRLKYQSDFGGLNELVATAAEFVRQRAWPIDVIVPVPPSKARMEQPVLLLAHAVSDELGVKCADGVVVKVKATPPLKDSEPGTKARLALLENAFRIEAKGVSSRNVLLFDDTYDSGATMKSVAEKLYSDGHAATVYALTLTITRTGSRS